MMPIYDTKSISNNLKKVNLGLFFYQIKNICASKDTSKKVNKQSNFIYQEYIKNLTTQ